MLAIRREKNTREEHKRRTQEKNTLSQEKNTREEHTVNPQGLTRTESEMERQTEP
jgi:hypothetical protein